MPIVTTADRKHFRFADVGDKLKQGETQVFYRLGPNGGIILDRRRPKRRRIRWLALHILYFTFNRTPENQRV